MYCYYTYVIITSLIQIIYCLDDVSDVRNNAKCQSVQMAMAIARSSGIQSDNAVHGCPNEEDGLAERKDMDIVADGETGQAKNGMDIFCSLIILY